VATLAACAAGAAPAPAAVWGVSTLTGDGNGAFAGDGGPASAAEVSAPPAVAVGPDGSVFVADFGNHRVRRVAPDGTISTFAGTGAAGSSGDGGPATSAQLNGPRGLAFDAAGALLITDRDAQVVRRVAPDGTISTVAGSGVSGYTGDGGAATAATLKNPYGATPLPGGGFVIADRGNHVIRRVAPDGRISTAAGTGVGGFSGDGGPATAATLNAPCAVTVAPDGSFLFPDRDNDRVRRVDPKGIITTILGTGAHATTGDGGPAVAASSAMPYALAFAGDGALIVVERDGARVRRIDPDGTISTIAGTGVVGFGGDGGAALGAWFNGPVGVAVAPDGSIYVADQGNHRIRRLTPGFVAAPAAPAAEAPAPAPRPTVVPRPAARLRLRAAALRVRARRALRVRFTVSAAATVELTITRRGRRAAVARVRAHPGSNVARIRRLRAGRYRVRLAARGADGQVAAAVTSLVVRR
jgi:glucose/arabinose dehydrogenase